MMLKGVVLTGLRGGTALGGLLLAVATLRVFGVGFRTDALFIAQLVPLIFGRQIWGMLVHALLPCLYEQEGPEKEVTYVREASTLLIGGSALLAVLLYAAAPLLVRAFAPGFDLGVQALALRLFRILCPCLPFLVGCGLYGTLLASRKCHLAQASSQFLWRVGAIGFLWFPGRTHGIEAYAACLTLLTGLQFFFLLGATARKGLPFLPIRLAPGAAARFAPLRKGLVIGLVALGLGLAGDAMDRAVLSTLAPGSVTLFGYAGRIANLVPGILLSGILIQLLPGVARAMVKSRRYRVVTRRTSVFVFHLGCFLSLLFLSLARPVGELLGAAAGLAAPDVSTVWVSLSMLLVGIPARYAVNMLRTGFRFERNLGVIATIGGLSLALRAPLLFGLKGWGPPGIALASVVEIWVHFAALWWLTGRGTEQDASFPPFRAPRTTPMLLLYTALVLLPPWSAWLPAALPNLLVKGVLGTAFCGLYLRIALPAVDRIVEATEA
jgi:peptidoglycan biosynthesis protein MviN/MurJ (putative lipid II flippase)